MTDFALDPSYHEEDTASKIVFALERLSHLFRIYWWEQNKTHQLSPLQMQIVVTLRFLSGLDSVSQIAGYLELTNATVSDAVRVLEAKGYLAKHMDSEDGRRHHLILTTSGKDTAESLALFANQIRDFVSLLPNQGIFLESLLSLMKTLQEHQFIPLQQMCTSCRHLRVDSAAAPYYCQLLDKPLISQELRIYCPDHEAIR